MIDYKMKNVKFKLLILILSYLEIRKTAWFLLFVLSLSKFFWLEFARFKFSRDFLGNNYHVDLVKLEIGDSACA